MPTMAFDESFDVTNPAELAQPFAIDLAKSPEFLESDVTPKEDFTVARINNAIGMLGLRGTYWVEAGVAMISRPIAVTKNFSNRAGRFTGLNFEGRFMQYELVKTEGADMEQKRIIRALCMAFTDATLLPYFDKLRGDNIVYVPVVAVDGITRTQRV